jgi:hypothetical protein
MTETKREDYTWDHATKDLSLSTRMTLREAGDITYQLRGSGLHPYNALPVLVRLFAADRPAERGGALAALLNLATDIHTSRLDAAWRVYHDAVNDGRTVQPAALAEALDDTDRSRTVAGHMDALEEQRDAIARVSE